MQRRLMLFLLFLICTTWGVAQNSIKELKSQADQYFSNNQYPEALNLYLKYQRAKSIDDEIRYKMGLCYLMNNEITEARKHLEFIVETAKKPNPSTYYYIARSYHAEHEFVEAAKAYKTFLAKTSSKGHALRGSAKDALRRCVNGFNIKSVGQGVIVENLGEYVNSTGDDFGPVLSPNYSDKIYFSSSRADNVGGLRSEDGIKSEPYGHYKTDIFSSRVTNGQWGSPMPLGNLINSSKNDVILGFNSTGQTMYYFKSVGLFSGEALVDTFAVDKPPVNPSRFESSMICENGDNYPYFFNDTILLFSSNREGGYGGMDLYISMNVNNVWTTPENLGPRINSAYDEITPFLAVDGRTLYFSSNNLKSIGGFDIFKSTFNDRKKEWSVPENVGVPVNSAKNDAYFKLSKNGMQAFFSSSRIDGYGMRDIYIGYFNAAKKEQSFQSQPVVFSQVGSTDGFAMGDANEWSGIDNSIPNTELVTHRMEALTYIQADNVLTPANAKKLDKLARILLEHPQIKVELESHSDITGPSKFDLYFSTKRGETIAEYLISKGVQSENILIKGCGVNYPIANGESESGVNDTGKRLNRRIYLRFYFTTGTPMRFEVSNPKVASFLKNESWALYNKAIDGLSYKVQVASMKQMYSGDVISFYPNATIEATGTEGVYKYTVGLYKTYYSADALRKELERSGLEGVFVVPYINGLRASVEDAKIYTTAFPDLENFLTGEN